MEGGWGKEGRQAIAGGWGHDSSSSPSPFPSAELVCEYAAAQVPRSGDVAEPSRGVGQGLEEGTGTRHAVLQ